MGPQQGPRKKQAGWSVVRAATKVSRRLGRPVASWGPRYRYDVDIWRALLLHPRPVLSLLSAAALRHRRKTTEGPGGPGEGPGEGEEERAWWWLFSLHTQRTPCVRGYSAHCSDRPLWPGPDAGSFMRYCLIIRRQYRGPLLSHTCRHSVLYSSWPEQGGKQGWKEEGLRGFTCRAML